MFGRYFILENRRVIDCSELCGLFENDLTFEGVTNNNSSWRCSLQRGKRHAVEDRQS